jgi:hypothetical protein
VHDGVVLGHGEYAEAPGRLDRGDRRELAVRPMEGEKRGDVHIAHAIAIGHEECLVADIFAYPPETPAGHRVPSGLDQRDAPRLDGPVVIDDIAGAHVEGRARRAQHIVAKILLDDVALVAAADDEVVDPVCAVDFQDVPEDRLLADFDHRLGSDAGLLGKPSAETARKYYSLHHSSPQGLRLHFQAKGSRLT